MSYKDASRNIDSAFTTTVQNTSTVTQTNKSAVDVSGPRNNSLSNAASILGLNVSEAFIETENEEKGVNYTASTSYNAPSEFVNTAGAVAQKYLKEKLERITSAFKTKVNISIGALLGEVSPYVVNSKEAVSLLVDKIDDLTKYMAGVAGADGDSLADLLDDLGSDMLEYMMNDPAMLNATSQLASVKTFGWALKTYSDIEATVSKILTKIEPFIPVLQIFTNIVLSYFSGGASATEAAQEAAELAEHYCQQLLAAAKGALKKYLYSITIPLPSIVVGALNSISVREAMLTVDYKNDWMRAIFDEDFYEQTMYSAQWQDSINTAINTTLGSYAEIAKNSLNLNFTNSKGEPITRGEFMKSKFMSTLTSSFMKAARASARKTAYISPPNWDQDKSNGYSGGTESAEYDTNDTVTPVGSALDRSLQESYANMVSINSLGTIINLSGQLVGNY